MKNNEEKTKDIVLHEKRVEARDRISCFKKIKKKAIIYAITALIILLGIASPFMLMYYDLQKPLFSLLLLFGVIILSYSVYAICGSVMCKNARTFYTYLRLSEKWCNAVKNMEYLEEKELLHTAFEGDIRNAEDELERLSDEVIKTFIIE